MTAPRVWKRGFVTMAAVLVVVLGAGVAQAEVAFRKKPTPSDDTGLEGSPSGGEPGTEAAPAGEAKASGLPQAEDKDTPEAQAEREKARADAALARKAKNDQLAKSKEGAPIYQTWQFWAIAGGVVVGAVLAIWAGSAVYHQANGGDVRGCTATMYPGGCYGEGR